MSNAPDITAVLPMRKGSQRIPNKNTKPFATYHYGLAELKIKQLLCVDCIAEILLDTDEPKIYEIINSLDVPQKKKKIIRIEERDPDFAGSEVTTDSLIRYLGKKIRTKDVIWTHTTSPFIDETVYENAIKAYLNQDSEEYDSLMSVTKLQEFIWDTNGPKNYDYSEEKWPRTQTLPPWYFVNSGIFCCPTSLYTEQSNRIGDRPFLYELHKIEGFDVDWPIDFEIAETIYERLTKERD